MSESTPIEYAPVAWTKTLKSCVIEFCGLDSIVRTDAAAVLAVFALDALGSANIASVTATEAAATAAAEATRSLRVFGVFEAIFVRYLS
jgi:hypothetical protein